WPSGQRDLAYDCHRIHVDDGRCAAFAERLPEIETVHAAASGVVGESVRMGAYLNPAKQLLVGAAKDAHSRARPIGGEEQVVFLVDENTRDARQVMDRANVHL